ncbi:MAG: hypothetical protein CM1200mP26_30270 [Acidimicrobiales bacterium]|nr:MAG: hypothetical protein CM1200mP26_30270 [Acidimicrobiales bacterium]
MRAPVLTVLGIICLAAAFWVGAFGPPIAIVWSVGSTPRGARRLHAGLVHVPQGIPRCIVYGLLALASLVNAFVEGAAGAVVFSTVAIPALVSTAWARHAVREARMARQSIDIERRAQGGPPSRRTWPQKGWAGRLAPEELPQNSLGLRSGGCTRPAQG